MARKANVKAAPKKTAKKSKTVVKPAAKSTAKEPATAKTVDSEGILGTTTENKLSIVRTAIHRLETSLKQLQTLSERASAEGASDDVINLAALWAATMGTRLDMVPIVVGMLCILPEQAEEVESEELVGSGS